MPSVFPLKDQPQRLLRTASLPESVITEMSRIGDACQAVNLSQGLPDFDPPPEVLEAATRAIRDGQNQYSIPFGLAPFRQAIADKFQRYNGVQADPETEVTVTCGVSEGLVATILALTQPGDEVIILEPWFESYVPDCLLAGVVPRLVELQAPDYLIDPDVLRSAFNKRTRLIVINTPHNPTGRVFTREELENIAGLCQEFDVVAVVDETYENILYDGHIHLSLASLAGMQERTVTLGGLGKSYAVTGWRIGWVVAPEIFSQAIRKVHVYLTVCAATPFQWAGIAALSLPESYYQQMRHEYARRKDILSPALRAAGFIFREPEGSYFLMGDFSEIEWDPSGYERPNWSLDRVFAEFLVRKIGVAIVPGYSFYVDGRKGCSSVRFNFAKQDTTLIEAAKRLSMLKKA